MQTISFLLLRLQESGLGSQDFFQKSLGNYKKICLNHFYIKGKYQHMFFFVLIIRFRQFGAENFSFKFFKSSETSEM